MERFWNGKDRAQVRLSFFLIFGAVMGTLFCCLMDEEMRREFLNVESSLLGAAAFRRGSAGELLWAVVWKRWAETAFLLLMLTTPFSEMFVWGTGAYLGFSTAVLVCGLTMDGGVWGLLRYLALVFPQGIVYAAVIYFVGVWMRERDMRMSPAGAVVILGIVGIGAVLEGVVNPFVAGFIL